MLMSALLTLHGLLGDACTRDEYCRGITAALLTWTPWHDAIPGCLYSEEMNEAALSRLGQLCRTHPQAITCAEVMDLYLHVQPPASGWKRLSQAAVPRNMCDLVTDRIRRLVQHGVTTMTYVPWVQERVNTIAQSEWPSDVDVPLSLQLAWPADGIRRCLRTVQTVLVRQTRAPDAAVLATVNGTVKHRSPADVQSDVEEARRLTERAPAR
jgi:hypothetical protein